MAIGDKYVLTLNSRLVGSAPGLNEFANVFAFEETGGAGNCADLRAIFGTGLYDDIRAVTSVSIEYYQIYTINLDNLTDFDLFPLSANGLRTGEYLPLFNGWEYRYYRATRGINDGRKTFAGVAEQDQANGVATGTVIALLNTLATRLGSVKLGTLGTYMPRIWRRAGNYGDPAVAYPDTFYPIVNVNYERISTQNTRKR